MTTYSNYNSYIRSKQSGGCWPQGPQGPQGSKGVSGGNTKRLYFTFTDFMASVSPASSDLLYPTWEIPRSSPGAAGEWDGAWVASKLMPVGYRLPADATVNILALAPIDISNIRVQTVNIDNAGSSAPVTYHTPATPLLEVNKALSLTGSLPSAGSGEGTPMATEMISIRCLFINLINQYFMGAYVDIERF